MRMQTLCRIFLPKVHIKSARYLFLFEESLFLHTYLMAASSALSLSIASPPNKWR